MAQPATPEERSGLNRVMWFGIIQIVGMVVGWVSVFFIFGLQFGTLAGLVAVIGGILALIGLIGGQILGLWRLGSKYDETIIKLGAIFDIIPLLNIVAPFLILIGTYQVKGRLEKPA